MFEVQTKFLYGWENCWTVEKDGEMVPEYFDTIGEAQASINELLADVKEAVSRGDMEEEYDPEDYRIVQI